MVVSLRQVVGVLLAVVMAVGYTTAQEQPQQDQTRERQAGSAQSSQAGELDQHLAKWLIAKNKAEVELSRVGAEQAQNREVQEFARQLVQEHQQMIQQLEKIAGQQQEKFAGEAPVRQERAFRGAPGQQERQDDRPSLDEPVQEREDQPSLDEPVQEREDQPSLDEPVQEREDQPSLDEPGQEREVQPSLDEPGQEGQDRPERAFRPERGQEERPEFGQTRRPQQGVLGSRTSTGGDSATQLVEMIGQVEAQIGKSLKKGLEQKESQEFDQAFIGLQVLGHMAMLDTLEVMKSQASGQLQQTIEEAQQSVEQHLQQAQELNKQLDQQG